MHVFLFRLFWCLILPTAVIHLQQSSDGASVHGFKGLSYSQIAAMVLAATPDGEICHGINFLVVSNHFATKLSSPTHLSTLYTAVNEKTSSVQVVSRFMSSLVPVSVYQTLVGPANAYAHGRVWNHAAMQEVIKEFGIVPVTDVGSISRAVHPVFKALFVVLNGECGVQLWKSQASGKAFRDWYATNPNTYTHLFQVRKLPSPDVKMNRIAILKQAAQSSKIYTHATHDIHRRCSM
jgi:hypothetical protein